jgi:hypothetical protein
MAEGSQLRSGGETWGPVSPDNVQKTGVSPGGQSGSPIVAAEAEQVERTRRKTWSRFRSEVFVPYRGIDGSAIWADTYRPLAIAVRGTPGLAWD